MYPQLPAQLVQLLAPSLRRRVKALRLHSEKDIERDHPRMESTNPRLPAHSFIRSLFVDGSPQ
jgi:hypothetical protein